MIIPKYNIFAKLKYVSFDDVVSHFYQARDPSSLGIIRLLFDLEPFKSSCFHVVLLSILGILNAKFICQCLLMMLDLPQERGGSDIFVRYGNPQNCHFPLFDFIKPLNYEWMSVLYGLMWIGTLGIMLGFQFHISVLMFIVPYWYIFLLDKSFWNNHTYLYGIVATLLFGTSANNYCSLDSLLNKNVRSKSVPYWNYFILKFQFFMLYFLAGLKKTDWEWLEGYSMSDMGNHWVFFPFRLILNPAQIDHLVIHWFGFLLDLTIGFWMVIEVTRPAAMVFCALFHLMNSRMFSIGMFPYVCLVTMPLFCQENWPVRMKRFLTRKNSEDCYTKNSNESAEYKRNTTWKQRMVVCLLLGHCLTQTVLPFSHSITKGYNNWTKGLYGYSWDMMIHGWDTILVVVRVVDNDTGQEHFLDSSAWTSNDRWTKHADMCLQYARCIEENLAEIKGCFPIHGPPEAYRSYRDVCQLRINDKNQIRNFGFFFIPSKLRNISKNISVYIDVWCSMNGRIQQRMFDPNYDLLKANWSVFRNVEWLLPLISDYSTFRNKIKKISEQVYSWSNFSEVIFVSDFPGLHLENYIGKDLRNVSLTILEGEVLYESEEPDKEDSDILKLMKGAKKSLNVGQFHKIYTIGDKPSCFMYTYVNSTKELTETPVTSPRKMYSPFPLIEDINHKIASFNKMFNHICTGFQFLLRYFQ